MSSQLTTDQIQSYLASQGSDPFTAADQAHGILFGIVQQQAALISFLQAFLILGIFFLCMLPVLFLLKKPEEGKEAPPMH